MRRFGLQHFIRLAVIALLVANVVPDALAAVPLCKSEFGTGNPPAVGTTFATQPALKHSHENLVAHECVATMPDKQAAAKLAHVVPDGSVAVFPAVPHPAARLAARGPSPRGSPVFRSTYLSQRSSVLLLI